MSSDSLPFDVGGPGSCVASQRGGVEFLTLNPRFKAGLVEAAEDMPEEQEHGLFPLIRMETEPGFCFTGGKW